MYQSRNRKIAAPLTYRIVADSIIRERSTFDSIVRPSDNLARSETERTGAERRIAS